MEKRIPTETERPAETDLKLRPEAQVEMSKQRLGCENLCVCVFCVYVHVYVCVLNKFII